MEITVIHKDPYPNESVEEIIEHCRQMYFKKGCDKFKPVSELKKVRIKMIKK
jgi:hypothetical protein